MKKLLLIVVCLACAPLVAQVNNNAIIYADQYNTLTYQQIVDNVCPASTPPPPTINGCTIYATSPNASNNIGNLDPGNKQVTLYLGPTTYNVTTIILRSGLRIIGMGATPTGTVLQISGGSTAIFNLPPTLFAPDGKTPAGITDVYLYGLRLLGTKNNTTTAENGIVLDTRYRTNGGLWHSSFEDLTFLYFHGSAILMMGPTSNTPTYILQANQFLSMRNMWATRPDPGAAPDLWIDGQNGQIDCVECHFDGPGGPTTGVADGWTNVFIGNLNGGTARPYSIHFVDLSTQFAHFGVQIEGAQHLTFIGTHHEDLFGAYQITNAGGLGTYDVLMLNDSFAGNVGRNGGYMVYADNAYNIILDSSFINGGSLGPPTSIVAGPWAGYVSLRNIFNTYTTPQQYSIFAGDLHVNGTVSKLAGSFKIDHPLDPENKYLSHSFVESPDMMNIYNGIVILDKAGTATVKLPDYFEALNQDFRYQLTCIGRSAGVYVADEIRSNSFRIAGGKPGLKVSWQVTGIRHDAYANKHRIVVEEEKPAGQRGHLLNPDLPGLENAHPGGTQ